MKRNYPSIIITPEGEKWLDKGQMWMYKNNLGSLDDSIENGSLVDIMTTQGRYLGTGFLSKESHITVRIFCLLYTSPSPRDRTRSRMPSSA